MAYYIPIIFPNYAVGSRGDFTVPVGHAGVLIVNNDGTARYEEWGRYRAGTPFVVTDNPSPTDGNLREFRFTSDTNLLPTGQLDTATLKSAFDQIMARIYPDVDVGYGFATPFQITQDQANTINQVLNNQSFAPYGIYSNSCLVFVNSLATVAGVNIGGLPITHAPASAPPLLWGESGGPAYVYFSPASWYVNQIYELQQPAQLPFSSAPVP